jgi:acylpyruvate hydrolase
MAHYTFTNGESLAVGTMFCIGRNYSAHAKEMGAEVPEKPLVFIKPPQAYIPNGGEISIPSYSSNMHHEAEIVVVIKEDCDSITSDKADSLIAGYGIGLDLTLRDVQTIAKQKGEPWSVAKSFRGSAPISSIVPYEQVNSEQPLEFTLSINGEVRQRGSTAQMERTIPELIAYCASVFGLRKGDCIFTGTPEGVAQLNSGDSVHLVLHSYTELNLTVR